MRIGPSRRQQTGQGVGKGANGGPRRIAGQRGVAGSSARNRALEQTGSGDFERNEAGGQIDARTKARRT